MEKLDFSGWTEETEEFMESAMEKCSEVSSGAIESFPVIPGFIVSSTIDSYTASCMDNKAQQTSPKMGGESNTEVNSDK